jgi:hypothetical protein
MTQADQSHPTPVAGVPPNYYSKQADVLYARLASAEQLLQTAGQEGEKGHWCEQWVRDLLVGILPEGFGVGYGLVAYGDAQGDGTNPLDVIIWNKLMYAPLFREGGFVVVPPQSVAAVLEVKATLDRARLYDARDQLRAAFREFPSPDQDPPGFIIGFSLPDSAADRDEVLQQLEGTRDTTLAKAAVGVLVVSEDWARVKDAREWVTHARPDGFRTWYNRLIRAIYSKMEFDFQITVPAPVEP